MSSELLIVDYGMGNLNSVKRALEKLKVDAVISSKPDDILNCQKIILPGVGHFGKAMDNLKKLNLLDALNDTVLVKQKPILGICLGMELMAKTSEEGNSKGLAWFDADVVKFNVSDKIKFKVPHMGWNQVKITKNCPLMSDISELSEFYFSHSYFLRANDRADIANETEYDQVFTSAISKNNIFGVQYHPEKSHDAGARLLKNFIQF